MSRFRLAAALAVLVPAVAHAALPNGATLTFDMLKIQQDGGPFIIPATDDDFRYYLNSAHCVCSKAGLGKEQKLSFLLRLSNDTLSERPLEFFVGTNCGDDIQRPTMCRSIGNIANIDTLINNSQNFEFSLFDVVNGIDTAGACRSVDGGTAALWALVDTDGNSQYDHVQSQNVETTNVKSFDTKPPPLPTNISASSAENSIVLEWDLPTATNDIFAYQAFCGKVTDGQPGFTGSAITARYQTPTDVCGVAYDPGLVATDITVPATDEPDAGMPAMPFPDAIKQLDPAYLCGDIDEQTARSMTIRGLENNTEYWIALVAVDRYGNSAGMTFNQTVTPRSAIDFWEDLHDRGSGVEGGFCLTGEVGRGTAGGVGAIVLALALVTRRRSRRTARRAALVAAPFVLLALAPQEAFADTPYWDEGNSETAAAILEEDLVRWHIGLRFGPYTPGIDEQLGQNPGPYEEMFGGARVLPMLDVDRILWSGFGQIGIGGSIGYMQKTAKAYAEGTAPGEDRMRSPGDENTFRLIPLNVTAIWRLSMLDDLYGIPVVPYLRAGLGYYIWMVRTNGETAKACWDGTHMDGCDADKALGATIGFVASAGIAIRAERIDPDTATSMRASGIEHAGFFAEIQMAQINGFGVEQKLSVGDTTWFVGANFEF